MDDEATDVIAIAVIIALSFLVAVAFYRSMATRDVLVGRVQRLAGRVSRRWWVRGTSYALTVFVVIPALIVVWAAALEVFLIFVSPLESFGDIGERAVAIVIAVRMLAYANARVASELAKAVPFAILFLLLTGANVDLDVRVEAIVDLEGAALTEGLLGAAVATELVLRLLTDSAHTILREIRRRRGIDADEGVWRTLRAAIAGRRPLDPGGPIDGDR